MYRYAHIPREVQVVHRQREAGKSFVVTGISSALNGADDHLVRKDEPADDASDDDSDEEFLGFSPDEIAGTAEASVVSDYSDDDDDDDDDD